MKLPMTVIVTLALLQPLHYGIQSLIRLSCQRRTLYPLLRIQYPVGIRSLITTNETACRKPIPSFY